MVRVAVLRLDFWKVWMNYLDLIVCAASVAEVAVYYTDSSVRNLAILRATLALLGSDEIGEELLEQQL